MFKTIHNFIQDETGATAIEYGLIAGLISVAAVGAMQAMGTSLGAIFQFVSDKLTAAQAQATTP